MPPKPRMGSKKPSTSKEVAKPPQVDASTKGETSSGLSQEAEDQFELQLCWCIQQLEMCLATGRLPEKQVQDLTKNINILKSNTAPLIKKRQVMRSTLGNYREKMALDEQKLSKATSSIKFLSHATENKKCTFLKKAICNRRKDKPQLNNDVTPLEANEIACNVNDIQSAFKFNFHISE